MYKVNEVVVYRKDIYRISEIRKGSSKEDTFFVLVPSQNDDGSLKIQVPASNKMGYLRKLSTKDEIEALIQRIPEIPVIDGNNRMIENDYKARMKKPTLEDLVAIIKTTYLRNQERLDQNKKIGAVDNNYFKEAEKVLYQEIGTVLDMTVDQTRDYVVAALQHQK
ncbi:MAG: CarD family transcriptional regulator [Erysipelotrichaceae bacterium]|nr:CarD family transcriptional regulator [Erysipelotrichaceae bacterium]